MSSNNKSGCGVSVGLGSIAAMIVSWTLNHSLLWMLLHGFFGWLYLIYYIIFL